uniref:non-specific serine/threonine protein kinase n=1 Tax=Nicotiana tabacum TaxID=4097 RepID=Q84ZT8_TOBAC|nr:calcium/calmodulin protein kinase 1 [Nicotiana tabacum]AAS67891.1 calcium/calmodulin protein kinase [Nicotiana tabacum]
MSLQSHLENSVVCADTDQTLIPDDEQHVKKSPENFLDLPPESFWIPKDSEQDWFDENATIQRMTSMMKLGFFGKANHHSKSFSHRSFTSTLFNHHQKPKSTSLFALPQSKKTSSTEGNLKQKKVPKSLFRSRSEPGRKGIRHVREPGSPKVSCIGRVDYALQKAISQLAPTQQRKVELLIKAFETVVPPQGDNSQVAFPKLFVSRRGKEGRASSEEHLQKTNKENEEEWMLAGDTGIKAEKVISRSKKDRGIRTGFWKKLRNILKIRPRAKSVANVETVKSAGSVDVKRLETSGRSESMGLCTSKPGIDSKCEEKDIQPSIPRQKLDEVCSKYKDDDSASKDEVLVEAKAQKEDKQFNKETSSVVSAKQEDSSNDEKAPKAVRGFSLLLAMQKQKSNDEDSDAASQNKQVRNYISMWHMKSQKKDEDNSHVLSQEDSNVASSVGNELLDGDKTDDEVSNSDSPVARNSPLPASEFYSPSVKPSSSSVNNSTPGEDQCVTTTNNEGKKSPFFPSPAHYFFSKVKPKTPARSPATNPTKRFFGFSFKSKSTAKRPFPPPSPAKHIRAVLARRLGSNSSAIPEGAKAEGGGVGKLDKKGRKGEVGRGHFGHTCWAKFKKGELKNPQVAVKIISKAKMTTAIAIEDVRREVKILKALSGHQNLVRFYDAYEDVNNVYIVMELCEGGVLLDRILSRGGKYTEEDAKSIVVIQILNVVAFCHLQGVVHRDLKPENFLFTRKEEDAPQKVIDFGLSDFIRPDQRLNDIVGSAYYVAPEVLHKSYSVPIEADMWSIGVIAYILLSGSRPFWARTESGIFRADNNLLNNKEDHPKWWPSVSAEARDFVKRLNKDHPRKRMTASQALSHPWLRTSNDAKVPLDILIFKLMRAYLRSSSLRKAALKALSKTLTVDELFYLKEQAKALKKWRMMARKKKAVSHKSTVVSCMHLKEQFALLEESSDTNSSIDETKVKQDIKAGAYEFPSPTATRAQFLEPKSLNNFLTKQMTDAMIDELASELPLSPSLHDHARHHDWLGPSDGKLNFLGFVKFLHGVTSRSIKTHSHHAPTGTRTCNSRQDFTDTKDEPDTSREDHNPKSHNGRNFCRDDAVEAKNSSNSTEESLTNHDMSEDGKMFDQTKPNTIITEEERALPLEAAKNKPEPKPQKSKNWSKLKKLQLLPPTPDLLPEPETVDLRHQMTDERKKAEKWMLDYAMQHIVTTLTPARKNLLKRSIKALEKARKFNPRAPKLIREAVNEILTTPIQDDSSDTDITMDQEFSEMERVAMLVEAFEAVVPLPEIMTAPCCLYEASCPGSPLLRVKPKSMAEFACYEVFGTERPQTSNNRTLEQMLQLMRALGQFGLKLGGYLRERGSKAQVRKLFSKKITSFEKIQSIRPRAKSVANVETVKSAGSVDVKRLETSGRSES